MDVTREHAPLGGFGTRVQFLDCSSTAEIVAR
jgi:hypothetical protein